MTDEVQEDVFQLFEDPVDVRKKLLGDEGDIGIQGSNLMGLADTMDKKFASVGAIEPPLDPLLLTRLVSQSETLPALIASMAANMHGFGYRFERVLDFESNEGWEKVKTAMWIEREMKARDEAAVGEEPQSIKEPTDEEVTTRIESLKERSRREYAKLKMFFTNCSRDMPFERLCRKLTTDQETTGYCVFEVRRDARGDVARLQFAPSWTFRALPRCDPVSVSSRIRATDISWSDIKETWSFRRYVQLYEQRCVYFKDFGDRRVMSSRSGKFYKDERQFQQEEPGVRPATEVIWQNLDSSESDIYGNIRWSGCIPGALGSREQAEVNLFFFRSKAIPPLVVLVSGGKIAKGAKEQLQKVIEKEIKGKQNFHRILIIEAESGSSGKMASAMPSQDRVKIELKPLTDAIFKDALWMDYKEANKQELGQSFRIPPLLRGDTTNLNRATAQIAERYAERQVFGPSRRDFGWAINHTILSDMGIMLWTFKLNAPEETDADIIKEFVKDLVESTVSINEARQIVGERVFNTTLPRWDTDWANLPLKAALAGLMPEKDEEEEEMEEAEDDMEGQESEQEEQEEQEEQKQEKEPDVTRIRMTSPEFESMFVIPERV